MKQEINLIINEKYNQLTIKEILKSFYVGKAKIEEIRVNKLVKLNDEITSLESKVKLNDKLTFIFDEEINFVPLDKELDILYEDNEIIIINKPSGILIHPDNINNNSTLVNIVASYYLKNNIHREVRYIHRIDFDTSGIVVFSKDFLSFCKLNHEIENHQINRYYLALVKGKFSNKVGCINEPIGKDRHINNKYRVSNSINSKPSITNYEVVKEIKNYSLVKCLLETGRTHQIRVHMSYINHPLVGDKIYGGENSLNRTALHSYKVELVNPITNKKIIVKCPLPNDIKKVIGEYDD